ncbi:MAG: FAD-dependent oxidoreductase [Spirochaetes bacterium]|nr:FAD-dependent oxidoreductase [Spirochaetota bacterium]
MKEYDVIIIGGSAAGLTAAITARRHNADKTILLIRGEEKVMIPCGIPYIYGTLGGADKNIMPDAPLDANKVDLIVGKASKIDTAGKIVEVNGEKVKYEKLIIATGSQPIMPPIPGFDKKNVFPILKDMKYLDEMRDKLSAVKDLVVIGGGFIGFEFADECKKMNNMNVTIVEIMPHCLNLAYDEEFCIVAENLLKEKGIKIQTSTKVTEIVGHDSVEGVKLDNGETVPAQAVILGIGAASDVELADKAGIKIGTSNAILVDRFQRTSAPDVFACGDCAEKKSFFGGAPTGLKLASIAAMEARIAAANLYGIKRENNGTIGVFSTSVADTAFATAGLTEYLAVKHGYTIAVATQESPNRHPGGMPGLHKMTTKLIFEKNTGVLIGGQIMGGKAAGELINTVSALITNKMTAEDIAIFQAGTHPALTASPIATGLINAAEMAISMMKKN